MGAVPPSGLPEAFLAGRPDALEELLRSCPDFEVDAAAGEFAAGNYVRRYSRLPFEADP